VKVLRQIFAHLGLVLLGFSLIGHELFTDKRDYKALVGSRHQ